MDAKKRTPRIARGAALGAVALLAVYAVGLGLLLPPIARKVGADKLGEALGRPVAIERIRVNPFTLAASVEGVRIFEADGRTVFAAFDTLDLEVSPNSLRHLAPVFDSATLRGLDVKLVRDGEAHYNVTDIVERLGTPSPTPRRAAFSVSNIHVAGGRVELDDRPMKARHQVDAIDIAIPFVSSLPVHAKDLVKPAFSARVNGAPLRLEAETLPFEPSLATNLAVEWKGVDMKRYASYPPVPLPVAIGSGTLDARLTIRFEQAKGSGPSFRIAGTAAIADLAAAMENAGALRAASIEVDLAELRPLARTLKLAAVRAKDFQVTVEESEYPRFVRAAYAFAKLPPGELSVAEMETRLLEHAAIDEAALQKLAVERAVRVMGYLTGEGKLATERVLLASAPAAAKAEGSASRVVFELK